MRQWRGFTLLELMIVIVVLGVLLSIAVPSFKEMSDRNKLTATTNDLIMALLSARSEAVKYECDVLVDKNSRWGYGWVASVTSSGGTSGCTGLEILRHETYVGSSTITAGSITISSSANIGGTVINNPGAVKYNSQGRMTWPGGSGTGKFGLALGDQARAVCLTLNGRPYVPEGGSNGYDLTQWLALCP